MSRKTYFGQVCKKHPDLKGERVMSCRQCVMCKHERKNARRRLKKQIDPTRGFCKTIGVSGFPIDDKHPFNRRVRERWI